MWRNLLYTHVGYLSRTILGMVIMVLRLFPVDFYNITFVKDFQARKTDALVQIAFAQ